MSSIYLNMVGALRSHWSAHDQQYPQRFELTDVALREFIDTRKLVNDTMNYVLTPGWESVFLGVPIQGGSAVNAMVAADGTVHALAEVAAAQ